MTTLLTRGALTAALLLPFAVSPRPALAQDDVPPDVAPAEAPTPAPAETTIEWVDGFGAGAAAAKESGRLMLVYVHRVNPP